MRTVLTFLLAGALAAQTNTPGAKSTISGVVKDTSGTPVSEISVSAVLNGDPRTLMMAGGGVMVTHLPITVVTDESGSYSISVSAPAGYSVSTERDPTPKSVHVDVDQEVTVDFVVPANAVISGRVVDQNDEPAVDAFVWLLKSTLQRGALKETVIGPKVTMEDGSYSFDTGLEANRGYYVVVDRAPPDELIPAAAGDLPDRQPIEVPTYYPSATQIESATPVILQLGENRQQVDIKITTAPFYCVEGRIRISGKPAATNFAIQEAPLAGTRLARMRTYSDGDGKYHVCGLTPGSYQLSTQEDFTEFAISNGDLQHVDLSMDAAYPKLQIDWDGTAATPELPTLNAQAEATLRKLAGFMGLGVTVDELKKLAMGLQQPDLTDTVRVQAAADAMTKMQAEPDFNSEMGNLMSQLRPMSNLVNVTLAGIGNHFAGPIRSSVPSGEYTVEVFSPIDAYPKEVTFNDLKLSDGIVRIPPASSGTLHVLMARDTANLIVAVTDTNGKPMPNATVVVVPDSVTTVPALSRTVTHGKTDQNGNYSARSLPPGKYRVLATPQSVRWDVPEDLERVLLVMFQAKEVELESKATLQITLEPIPI